MKITIMCFRNQLLLWLSVLLLSTAYAQNVQEPHIHAGCGLNAAYIQSLGQIPAKEFLHEYDMSTAIDCGKFRILYRDLQPGYPAVGFADPVLGAARRNTLCAVLTYVQSVFDFSAIPASSPILLEVDSSLVPGFNPALPTDRFLAFAGPTFGGTGISGGFINDYVTTGINPAGPDQFHAHLTVNFDIANNFPIQWLNDYTQPMTTGCKYDLFSVLLHEIGHAMGFISTAVDANGNLDVNSVLENNRFTRLDWQLQKSDDMPSTGFTKLILGSYSAPFMNPALSGPVTGNNFWLNNQQAPRNYPVYSGQADLINMANFLPGSVLSHMDEQFLAYTQRARRSPGYAEDYVMGPFASQGTLRRQFAKEEIRLFMDMAYDLNPAYNTTNLFNRPPYSTKTGNYVGYQSGYFPDLIATPDYTLVNNTGASLTINLWQDATLLDIESDIIRVDTSTIFNIRGCGNGGNNHNQLTVSADRRSITFTPRANFFGRAQFAFRLTDDKDDGSWHMYTIDVSAGSNVVFNPGSNLILNGDLENGMEVRRTGADVNKSNSSKLNSLREGFLRGTHLSDARPLNFTSNWWVPHGAGDIIRNAYAFCYNTPEEFGSFTSSFPGNSPLTSINNPDAAPNGGDRYTIINGVHNFYTLGAPMQSCERYVLKFDYMNRQDLLNVGMPNYPLTLAFTNQATIDTLNPWNALTPIYSVVNNVPVAPANTWVHYEIPFTYCETTPANFLNLRFANVSGFMADNLELVQVTTPPPPLTATISGPSSVCSGASGVLTANVSNALCNVTYLWSTGETTQAITVSPTSMQSYSVIISDGCRQTHTSKTVQVTQIPVITTAVSSYNVCEGTVVTVPAFSSSPAGATFSWTNNNTSTGLGTAGNGNINPFTAQNPFNTPTTSTVIVTPFRSPSP